MWGLPEKTTVHKLLPKSQIYAHFHAEFTAERRRAFDESVSRLYIEHELSPRSLGIAASEGVAAVFILRVELKKEALDEKSLALLARLLGQKTLFVLEYKGRTRLAIYETRLLLGPWQDDLALKLTAADTAALWQELVLAVTGYELEKGRDLGGQIEVEGEKEKLKKKISTLKKKLARECQPRRKAELHKELLRLKNELASL